MTTTTTTTPEENLRALGLTLPPAPAAKANYVPASRVGNLLFLSGHLPARNDGTLYTGALRPAGGGGVANTSNNSSSSNNDNDNNDPALSVEYGYEAARQVGLNLIATLHHELNGDLNRVVKIVKLFGIVQCTFDFHEQHLVMNGCSDVMAAVFGPTVGGNHTRSAIGTHALPLDISVEVEAIVEIKD